MEENTMEFNLEFPTASVKKGDVIGSALYNGLSYDAVWVDDVGSNFKLVEKDEKPHLSNNNKIQAICPKSRKPN